MSRAARRCCSPGEGQQRSTAIGPLIRLFERRLHVDSVRRIEVSLKVEGDDGFTLQGRSSMSEIARDPADLVRQLLGRHHQYPDGAVIYLGTMFAPVEIAAPRASASPTNPRRDAIAPSSACWPTAWPPGARPGSRAREP